MRVSRPAGSVRLSSHRPTGLPKSTLAITANPVGVAPVLLHVDPAALEARHRAVPVPAAAPGARAIVGCGRPLRDAGIVVVDPVTERPLGDCVVGEIWASGPTIAAGYSEIPAATGQSFGARLAGNDADYLRTGDLGFMHEGELFIAGRLKDVIIIHGLNYYPQDFERTAFRSHAALRPECCAASRCRRGRAPASG